MEGDLLVVKSEETAVRIGIRIILLLGHHS